MESQSSLEQEHHTAEITEWLRNHNIKGHEVLARKLVDEGFEQLEDLLLLTQQDLTDLGVLLG